MYTTSQANNENYNLREMLQQPDREELMTAMKKEVASLFKEEIWEMVPRQRTKGHYASQRQPGHDIKRERKL